MCYIYTYPFTFRYCVFTVLYVSNAANEQCYYSATASEGTIYWEIRRSYLPFLGVGAWHNIIIIFMVLQIYFVAYIVTPK